MVAEEAQVEVPANDDDFVMLINEIVKKATVLRVKRNNAGYSDLEGERARSCRRPAYPCRLSAESNDEKEVDEEMASAGLTHSACAGFSA